MSMAVDASPEYETNRIAGPVMRSVAPDCGRWLTRQVVEHSVDHVGAGSIDALAGQSEESRNPERGSRQERRRACQHDASVAVADVAVRSHAGEPLDPSTRNWFEPRFGHDF